MTVRNAKPLLAVLGYFALSFCGFSLLYRWGVPYNGGTIHIYAIPMMLLMALYVCWVNGGQPLHRRDFLRRRGDLGLFLLPYLALLMVAASFLEAAILGRFSVDLVCMAVLTFLIGLCEEGLFRSCLLKDRGSGTARAVGLLLYSSVTFAVLHMVNVAGGLPVEAAVTQSLGSFPFGLVAGFLYLRTGHLTGLAFWHMSVDYKIFASMAAPLKSVLVVGELVDLVMIAALVWGVVRTVQDGKKQRKAGADGGGVFQGKGSGTRPMERNAAKLQFPLAFSPGVCYT